MSIARGRTTFGARLMPDDLDSNYCGLMDGKPAHVRLNLGGIWTNLCRWHVDQLRLALDCPEPSPKEVNTCKVSS
jgi:hypothetical protein